MAKYVMALDQGTTSSRGAFGYCGDRYHQPEGNHNLLFQKDGKADLQCHLLAVPQNCGGDRPAEGGGL